MRLHLPSSFGAHPLYYIRVRNPVSRRLDQPSFDLNHHHHWVPLSLPHTPPPKPFTQHPTRSSVITASRTPSRRVEDVEEEQQHLVTESDDVLHPQPSQPPSISTSTYHYPPGAASSSTSPSTRVYLPPTPPLTAQSTKPSRTRLREEDQEQRDQDDVDGAHDDPTEERARKRPRLNFHPDHSSQDPSASSRHHLQQQQQQPFASPHPSSSLDSQSHIGVTTAAIVDGTRFENTFSSSSSSSSSSQPYNILNPPSSFSLLHTPPMRSEDYQTTGDALIDANNAAVPHPNATSTTSSSSSPFVAGRSSPATIAPTSSSPSHHHSASSSNSLLSKGRKPTSPPPLLQHNGFSNIKEGLLATMNGNGVASLSSVSTPDDDRRTPPAASSSRAMTRVNLPGSTIYPDSWVDREELVRLMVQTLRDVGYAESALTLEAESGYALETPQVAEFRRAVLSGEWQAVVESLPAMGIPAQNLQAAKYLVSQQHYLELLEQRGTNRALTVLRSELAPLSVDSDKLHVLSSLMMCSDLNDLRLRAKWDGVDGTSRRKLLTDLQQYIPTGSMLPARRLNNLLDHARAYQRSSCLYHDPRAPFSLYEDHECSRARFPTLTTYVLMEHEDEVWNIAWSRDGRYLVSASKDRTAVIWKIGPETEHGRECSVHHILRDHKYGVTVVAWSMDDSILITGSEQHLKMWNVQTGIFVGEMKGHRQSVSACVPLPNGSGYVSGGMDKSIIFWDREGKLTDEWKSVSMRVLDLAVTPDGTKLVAVTVVDRELGPPSSSSIVGDPYGFVPLSSATGPNEGPSRSRSNVGMRNGHTIAQESGSQMRRRVVIYDLTTKEELFMLPMRKEITSLSISADSKYALINHAPDDLMLWDLETHRTVRKYTGQRQQEDVIRSCFGGQDGDFVLSGSEDSNVYIWRKDTGTLMEVLSGHEGGSVNAVAWNPMEVGMFASCSDDRTIRIWEAPPPGLDDIPMPNADYDGHQHQSTGTSEASSGGGGSGRVKSPPHPSSHSRREGSWDGGGSLSPRVVIR
ncbi:hypothetical protein FRB93_002229 [Tulasnella sp. JGI-2019a]|nr:hypothetical protein FRB93_002229 [Tulasnella sp. JGI-2019a]